jgi:hypothetical protein
MLIRFSCQPIPGFGSGILMRKNDRLKSTLKLSESGAASKNSGIGAERQIEEGKSKGKWMSSYEPDRCWSCRAGRVHPESEYRRIPARKLRWPSESIQWLLETEIESPSIWLNVWMAVQISAVFARNPADKSASNEHKLDDQETEFSGQSRTTLCIPGRKSERNPNFINK